MFEKEKYDNVNSVVKNVLSDDIGCHDDDGKEYICRTCVTGPDLFALSRAPVLV